MINFKDLEKSFVKTLLRELTCPTIRGLSFYINEKKFLYKKFNDLIADWRKNETFFNEYNSDGDELKRIRLDDLYRARKHVLDVVKYVPDELNKHISSPYAIIMDRQYGDSEDQAIAMMCNLIERGYHISQVYCIVFEYFKKVNKRFKRFDHTVCCIIDSSQELADDCYIIDPGLFDVVELGSVYFGYNHHGIKLQNVFNYEGNIRVEFLPFTGG